MKKFNIYALAIALGTMTLTSCEDMFGGFLDKQPSNDLTKEEVLSDYETLVYNHNDTYNFLLHGGSMLPLILQSVPLELRVLVLHLTWATIMALALLPNW